MKAQDLKNSILQLAIKGKLVPQNPEDEPASVLLEKIRTEKEKLIIAKKIKRNKKESLIYRENSSYYEKMGNEIKCIDDKIPFEIPESWEWVRLGLACNYGLCNSIDSDDIDDDDWLLDLKDIEKNTGKILVFTTKKDIKSKSKKHVFTKGEVLYSKLRPYLNKVVIAESDGFCTSEILPLDFGENIFNKYAQILLMSPYFINYAKNCSYGVKMPRLGTKDGVNALFSLPPLEEQKRIVYKIEELMPFIGKYGIAEEKLTKLNQEFLEKMRKSILNEAMVGKLVSQNGKDSSAFSLIEKIHDKKLKLIKQGKVRDKTKPSIIYKRDSSYYEKKGRKSTCIDDEISFDIPENWEWCRLTSSYDIFTGNSINKVEKENKYMNISEGYNYIATKDVGFDNKIDYDNGVKIPINNKEFRIASNQSVLLCIEGGSAGRKMGIVNQDICFGNKLCCFSSFGIYNEFLFYYLQSPMFKKVFRTEKTGIIGGVGVNKIRKLLLPVPPLEEQEYIVKHVKQIFKIIDKLENAILQKENNIKDLLKSDSEKYSNSNINPGQKNKVTTK